MNAVTTANLVGITGLARRLVQDGALDETTARDAMAKAAAARQPLPTWFAQNKLVNASQLAAANAVEFGMPLFDVSTFDASQNAMSLVSEELLRKHNVLPLFKRGGKLFVGTSNPTHSLDEIKFHTNLVVEPILVDEEQIKRTLEQWQSKHDTLGSALGQSLSATLLFDYPTIDALTDYLLGNVLRSVQADEPPVPAPADEPASMVGATARASARPICWVMRASRAGSRSRARRCQASRRRGRGHITESTPARVTPRRMNGATVAGRSMPPARPQAATAPP